MNKEITIKHLVYISCKTIGLEDVMNEIGDPLLNSLNTIQFLAYKMDMYSNLNVPQEVLRPLYDALETMSDDYGFESSLRESRVSSHS